MFYKFLYAAAFAAFSISGVSAAEVTLRLGHPVFESHPFHDAAMRFQKLVAEKSGGDIQIDIFPAGQLGNVEELMQGVRLGTVDIAISDVSANYDSAPDLQAWQLPWLIPDYKTMADLAQTDEAKALANKLASDGVVSLTYYEAGQHSFFTKSDPITQVSEFEGMKVRSAPVRIQLELWEALGANPTPIAYGEIYSTLENGTIDALGINLTSVYSVKLYEVVKAATMTRHFFWPGALLINEGVFNKMTPEQQQVIREAAQETSRDQILAIGAAEDETIETLKGLGVSFHDVSPALHDELTEAVQPLYEKYGTLSPEVEAFIAKAHAIAGM